MHPLLKKSEGFDLRVGSSQIHISKMDKNGVVAFSGSVTVKDILYAAEIIKKSNRSLDFVCKDHGSFIADGGCRQSPTCPQCRDILDVGSEGTEEDDA